MYFNVTKCKKGHRACYLIARDSHMCVLTTYKRLLLHETLLEVLPDTISKHKPQKAVVSR